MKKYFVVPNHGHQDLDYYKKYVDKDGFGHASLDAAREYAKAFGLASEEFKIVSSDDLIIYDIII